MYILKWRINSNYSDYFSLTYILDKIFNIHKLPAQIFIVFYLQSTLRMSRNELPVMLFIFTNNTTKSLFCSRILSFKFSICIRI